MNYLNLHKELKAMEENPGTVRHTGNASMRQNAEFIQMEKAQQSRQLVAASTCLVFY